MAGKDAIKEVVSSNGVKNLKKELKKPLPVKGKYTEVSNEVFKLSGLKAKEGSLGKERGAMIRAVQDHVMALASKDKDAIESTKSNLYSLTNDYVTKYNVGREDKLRNEDNDFANSLVKKFNVFPANYTTDSADLSIFNPTIQHTIETTDKNGKVVKTKWVGKPGIINVRGIGANGQPIVDIIDFSFTNPENYDNYENKKMAGYVALLHEKGVTVNKVKVVHLNQNWNEELNKPEDITADKQETEYHW